MTHLRKPAESCASRCNHECSGLDVASCVLHCSTPNCEPHCCGCSFGPTECDGCGHCGPGSDEAKVSYVTDEASFWLGAGESVDTIMKAYRTAKRFVDRLEGFAKAYEAPEDPDSDCGC